MDALLKQRFEDQVTAALECQHLELVERHLAGIEELITAALVAADEIDDHLANLRKRQVRLPLDLA